jgi:NADPH-dependent 2,4-dienoyl-CoA reductase/sulfur reductase-like enzyme
VKGQDVYVSADPELVKKNMRPTKAPAGVKSEKKGVVIVGGGSGGLFAVEGLRESGYTGSIKILSKEKHIPIDRTKLSKALIDDPAKLAVRDEQWYKDNQIELDLDTVVKSVDVEAETVITENGKTVGYEHLILATGATPTVSLLKK